jgi:hypothetical protein
MYRVRRPTTHSVRVARPACHSRWRKQILVCAVGEGTYPVVRQVTHWIHLGEEGSLGLTHDGENDRTMALPQLRI